MITRISTTSELKQLYIEGLINNTSKITKVSDQSVNNAIAYGVAKVGQKTLKEIALVESHLFPDDAFGEGLDTVATYRGVAPRFQASQSAVYVRLVADPGTTYTTGTHFFKGQGKTFELVENVTVGSEGFAYAKLRSQDTGVSTNVKALTITQVSPAPNGHTAVLNEYEATGGRDEESDQSLRMRIKNTPNILAKSTLEYITQVLIKSNNDILKVYSGGTNNQNQQVILIATQNGISLSNDELSQLKSDLTDYLSIGEFNGITNTSVNVELRNVEYDYVDVDFRVELIQNANVDEVRVGLQVEMSKYLDPRYWVAGKKVEWDDLLEIVKDHPQVKNVADQFFNPRADKKVDPSKLPKVRGFIMRDYSGNILIDNQKVISPSYYPNQVDSNFQTTIVK